MPSDTMLLSTTELAAKAALAAVTELAAMLAATTELAASAPFVAVTAFAAMFAACTAAAPKYGLVIPALATVIRPDNNTKGAARVAGSACLAMKTLSMIHAAPEPVSVKQNKRTCTCDVPAGAGCVTTCKRCQEPITVVVAGRVP